MTLQVLIILEHANDASNTGSRVDRAFTTLWIETSTVGTVAFEDQWAGVRTLPFRNSFADFANVTKVKNQY